MYKVLIVDESFNKHEDSYKNIDWEKENLIVCCKTTIITAFDEISNNSPNIVIVNNDSSNDILKLLFKVDDAKFNIKFIILSSYENIQCINDELGSKKYNYLFKPYNNLNLIKEVLMVKRDLDEEKEAKHQDVFRKNIHIIKESMLREMLYGNINDINTIMELITIYTINFVRGPIVSTIIEIDEIESEVLSEKLDELRIYLLREFSNYKHFEIVKGKNVLIGVICIEDDINYEDILVDYKNIKDKVKIYFKFSITMAIGEIFDSLNELNDSYKSAKKVLEFKMIYGDDSVLSTKNVRSYLAELDFYPTEETLNIIDDFKANNMNGVYINVDKFYESLIHNSALSKMHIQEATNRLLGTICKHCITNNNIKSKYYNKIIVYERILKCNTIEKIKKEVNGFLREIKKQTSFDTNNELIKSVLKYIDENFSEPDLSLARVADEIFITPVYLSKLFKQETGVNFLDFIHKVRIEKAKNYLLDSDIKIYEVSSLVGYSNEKHFSKKFKKYVGKSPSEYRQENL